MASNDASRGPSAILILLFLPARTVFAFMAQLLATAIAAALGSADPWRAAAGWWMVYGTIADVLCLAALAWLMRRESGSVLGLLRVDRKGLPRQLLLSPLYLIAMVVPIAVAGVFTWLFYRSGNPPPQVALVQLPLWAAVYSIAIWPALWAFTEELTYLGYLMPRLESITGRTPSAAALVAVFWALQHAFLPFIPDAAYLISRVGAALIVAVGTIVIFLIGKRRLLPLIVAHWLADLASAVTAAIQG